MTTSNKVTVEDTIESDLFASYVYNMEGKITKILNCSVLHDEEKEGESQGCMKVMDMEATKVLA